MEYEFEAIGQMGPGAGAAIPVLSHWADPTVVARLPSPERPGHVIRWFDDPLPLPGEAAAALVQIAPEEAKGLGNLIAQALVPGPEVWTTARSPKKTADLKF